MKVKRHSTVVVVGPLPNSTARGDRDATGKRRISSPDDGFPSENYYHENHKISLARLTLL